MVKDNFVSVFVQGWEQDSIKEATEKRQKPM